MCSFRYGNYIWRVLTPDIPSFLKVAQMRGSLTTQPHPDAVTELAFTLPGNQNAFSPAHQHIDTKTDDADKNDAHDDDIGQGEL